MRKVLGHRFVIGSGSYLASAATEFNNKVKKLVREGYEPVTATKMEKQGSSFVVYADMTNFGESRDEESI